MAASSANLIKEHSGIWFTQSLVYSKYNRGDKTLPWEIPLLMLMVDDQQLHALTYWTVNCPLKNDKSISKVKVWLQLSTSQQDWMVLKLANEKSANRIRTYDEGNNKCLYIPFSRVVIASSTPLFCLYANWSVSIWVTVSFFLSGSEQSTPGTSLLQK